MSLFTYSIRWYFFFNLPFIQNQVECQLMCPLIHAQGFQNLPTFSQKGWHCRGTFISLVGNILLPNCALKDHLITDVPFVTYSRILKKILLNVYTEPSLTLFIVVCLFGPCCTVQLSRKILSRTFAMIRLSIDMPFVTFWRIFTSFLFNYISKSSCWRT